MGLTTYHLGTYVCLFCIMLPVLFSQPPGNDEEPFYVCLPRETEREMQRRRTEEIEEIEEEHRTCKKEAKARKEEERPREVSVLCVKCAFAFFSFCTPQRAFLLQVFWSGNYGHLGGVRGPERASHVVLIHDLQFHVVPRVPPHNPRKVRGGTGVCTYQQLPSVDAVAFVPMLVPRRFPQCFTVHDDD